MGTDNTVLVFMLKYTEEDGWGAISNFITKYSAGEEIDLKDVTNVSSWQLKGHGQINSFSLVKEIERNQGNFLSITKPENMYALKKQYKVVFFIRLQYAQLPDVVDLQNLYLLCDAYPQGKVIALIHGEQSAYHKTSQFFAYLTQNKGSVYESIFFNADHIKHLQLSRIGILSKFLPLIPINTRTESFLRQNVNKIVAPEIIEQSLRGTYEKEKIPDILAGALKILSEQRNKFEKCDTFLCARNLGGVDVLSFLIFCFLLEGYQDGFPDFDTFCQEMQKIFAWTNGCIQLIENIVFHSNKGTGAFSFRILEGEKTYIREKYAVEEIHTRWLELMITDYPGCSHTWNIAENFRERLTDGDIRDQFHNLCPKDFFEDSADKDINCAWSKYYLEKGNVVNHYGLKIFKNAIQGSRGYFILQSHSSHVSQRGETYSSALQEEPVGRVCVPGTSYSILLPVMQESRKEKFIDYGIEDYRDKLCEGDILLDYEVIPRQIVAEENLVSPREKADYITGLAQILIDAIEDQTVEKQQGSIGRRCVISINADAFQGNKAEVVYKSIILAMLRCDRTFHVVMYGCHSEFVQMFLEVSYLGWLNLKGEWHHGDQGQIALYTAKYYEEIIILPGDWNGTLRINQSSNFSRETRWTDYFEKWTQDIGEKSARKETVRYPFDILVEESPGNTIFEKYVETVVNRDIQNQELGCKISGVHMRLGSTIHVDHFYEAEVLFGNSFFVERFALLMIKRLYRKPLADGVLGDTDKLTLYGYANYSEQTIFSTIQFLRKIYSKIDVDYAILERDSEDRGFTHVERIRYSAYFGEGKEGEENRRRHFQSRKIVCVIPIASTLKTNEKMISLFVEENGLGNRLKFWKNFELILVGSMGENEYWVKEGKRISGQKGKGILPSPEFFAEVALEYMEPLTCPMCFPKHIIDEQPLVEVNAASTIPNQAFGLFGEREETSEINRERLMQEECRMAPLRDILLYRHLERNENHFLFYFQTERLVVQYPNGIREWLEKVRNEMLEKGQFSKRDYVILFCPAHFSNAGFIDYVNSYVFGNAAVVIRDDVDKEYRCNFRAKFSNLRRFAEKVARRQLAGSEQERQVRLFFVDDAIVTGHTFQRAKSLAQSIMEEYAISDRQKYAVFDGIFVLIDRNSKSSRWQYTGVNEEDRLHAFRTVHISSIRNHGDACVYCNLAKEAETLKWSSATRKMEQYWESEEVKFTVKPLVKYLRDREEKSAALTEEERIDVEQENEERKKRAFRRLVCTNNAMVFLKESYHGNQKEAVLERLLELALVGSIMHEGEEAEYFLSYCKVLSRPFRVFDKAVKEAVFDFLLVACLCALSGKSYADVISDSDRKQYLKQEKIREKFLEIERFVKRFFERENRQQDLVKVLLKQLTEMKSNFILRKGNMDLILAYAGRIGGDERELFVRYYKCLVKKLTGVNSDTGKSLWMDKVFKENWEYGEKRQIKVSEKSWADREREIREEIYLENVWIYQDAFRKLGKRVKLTDWQDPLRQKDVEKFGKELAQFERERVEQYITPYQFKDFIGLLQLYDFADDNGELYESGKVFVAANFLLSKFISDEFERGVKKADSSDEGYLTKVDYVAYCMKYIMDAKEVVIMMELDAEYDIWENKLIERYNAIVSSSSDLRQIPRNPQKEYLILGSSKGNSGGWTVREKEIIRMLQDSRDKEILAEKGCAYNPEKSTFLWELGHATEYPVYILARWENSKQGGISEIDRLNRIRCALQYYWQLNSYVFNKSNEGFFYELARQRKKAEIHSRQKAHTHTKNDIKLQQYNYMLDKENYGDYFQSDLLMLLADLNVSEHYRNSLTTEYYLSGVPFRAGQWDSELSLFANMCQFYVINSDMEKATELIVSYDVLFEGDSPLQGDEKVIAVDYTNAERETFLLIYSLMINAVTDGRGYMEDNRVTIYCSKTPEGRLRIANRVGDNPEQKSAEQIMDDLRYPPEEENQGISLWSMSRYIKRVIASILDERLKELERCKEGVPFMELERLGQQIVQMLGEEFQITVQRNRAGEEEYFSVLVPVLAGKFAGYDKL